MITPKQVHIARWCWGYVTRYPHSTAREIHGAQAQYSWAEICRALDELEGRGWVVAEGSGSGAYRGYVALVPFVASAPTWATHRV